MELKFYPNLVTVPINELLVPLLTGGAAESVEYWIRKLGVVPVEDWFGRRALKLEDARRVTQAYRAARDEHDVRWGEYVAWKAEERRKQIEAREKEFAAERARTATIRDKRRRQAEEESLQEREAARKAAEEQQGITFEEWSRGPVLRELSR